MRNIIALNENWTFTKPGTEPVTVSLPHTWNAEDGQDGGNDYWRGTAVYAKTFSCREDLGGKEVFLEVPAAAMSAEVILNGTKLACHECGYSLFRVNLTECLKEENTLEIRVDNSANDRVYPQMADFTFYGGLYRGVNLVTVSGTHFELVKDGTPGMKVTPCVDLKEKKASVKLETLQNGGDVVCFEIGDRKACAEVKDGYACAEIVLEDVHLWDGVNDPYLYSAKAVLVCDGSECDEVCVRFGCREFRMDPEKGFFLNGRSYPLRGVSRHQDRIGKGSALTRKDHDEDMEVVKELGANTLRLAHYQHDQYFYDLCDENGIVVWAEIPYITKHMTNGKANAVSQMRDLITQCYHHPSIVCWGLSNEITASGSVTEELLNDHRELNALCHRMDQTRPTVMAHAFMLEKDSPLIPVSDIASWNLYFGWYLGTLEQNDAFFDEYHRMYPDRVIGFSEYGADANAKFHSSAPEQGDYTEEYQCVYHEHLLNMIEERPYLWATHVWNLFDFAADGRDEGGKKGQNQKGLVEFDHQTKKDAFYLYKAAWSKEPFVHLCGKRYAKRAEETTQIRVYSNLDAVTLYMDGQECGTKTGRRVFTFEVPLSSEHTIRAVSGECCDEMTVTRVSEPEKEYMFRKQAVINWFDSADYDPSCYSIKDTMGDLKKNPQTAAILAKMMERMTASRGDVAKGTSDNANLQKLMEGLTLESLIRQAGDAVPGEMIRSLNAAFQRIKK